MDNVAFYDADKLPAYGDICAYEVSGHCCEPGILDGDIALVSAEALADLDERGGGYVVYTHLRDGKHHTARVVGYDGCYWHVESNDSRHGMMTEFLTGAIVGVVRDGETVPLPI